MKFRTILAATLATAALAAHAADANTWTGGDGGWSDPAHWQNAFTESGNIADHNAYLSVPGVTVSFTNAYHWGYFGVLYQVQLKNGLENPVVWTATDPAYGFTSDSTSTYRHLAVGTAGQAGSLEIKSGMYCFTNGSVTVAANDNGYANGKLIISGGTLAAQTLRVGQGGSCTANMTVSGGEVKAASNLYIGDGDSTGKLRVSGGVVTAAGGVCVGQGGNGDGELEVAGGEVDVTGGDLWVSLQANTKRGFVRVSDGRLYVKNSFKHGNKADGTAVTDGLVTGGAIEVGNEFAIGHAERESASFTFDGGTISAANLTLGNTTGATGTLTNNGGTVSATVFYLGKNASTLGRYVQRGGTLTVSNGVMLPNAASEGSIEILGGKMTVVQSSGGNGYFNMPNDGFSGTSDAPAKGTLIVGGEGEVEAQLIHVGAAKYSDCSLIVTGGTLNVTKYLRIGGKYQGGMLDATASGTYRQTAGTVSAKALELGSGGATGSLTLEGGTLSVPAITCGGTGSILFKGGVLKASAASSDFISSAITCTTEGTGLVIDTDSDITISATLSGTGGIVKRGAGTLTFTAMPTCTGDIRVESGKIVWPSGATSLKGRLVVPAGTAYLYDASLEYAQGIYVEEGASLVFSGTAAGTTTANVKVTGNGQLLVKTGSASLIGTATAQENQVTITISEGTATETVWCGPNGGRSLWTSAENWTAGVPTANLAAVFLADAQVVTMDECKTSKLVLNGHVLTLGAQSGDATKTLKVGAFDESEHGTLSLYMIQLEGAGGTSDTDRKNLTVPEGVTLVARAGDYASALNDNWGCVYVKGKTVVEAGATLNLRYCVDLLGGVEGAGTVNMAERGYKTTEGGRYENSRYFGGDWSKFTGAFTRTKADDERIVFCNDIKATNAIFNLYGDVTLGTNATATGTFTLSLGTLNYGGSNRRQMTYSSPSADYEVQVGGGSIANNKYFSTGNSATKTVNATLRKVGEDKFTYAAFGFNKIDVREGEFVFVNNPDTGSGTKINERYLVIDELTVASNAILSGTNATAIAYNDSTLDGLVVQTLTLAGFVRGPETLLTGVVNANAAGARVLVANASALTQGESLTLVRAKSITGRLGSDYALDPEGNRIGDDTAKTYWLSKVKNGELTLSYGSLASGLVIIVR